MMIKVAVAQFCATDDVDRNLGVARQLVEEAASNGAELVLVPENFCHIGSFETNVRMAEPLDSPGPILSAMIEAARSAEIHVLLGGMPTRSTDPTRYRNTAVLLSPSGEVLSSYNKIHLFDIDIPGDAEFDESRWVEPGNEAVTFSFKGAVFGMSICYDLRFPELYRKLAAKGAEVVCVPAAFTLHTGKDHWFPLLRARAIENQVYVLAAGQQGRHNPQRVSFGKSCVIDPWGAVIAQVSDKQGIAIACLDPEYQRQIRQQLPCLTHRRL